MEQPDTVTRNDSQRMRFNWGVLSVWVVMLCCLLAARLVAAPSTIERVYSRGFFPQLRRVWDVVSGLSPVPLFYVFWVLVIVVLARALVLSRREMSRVGQGRTRWQRTRTFFARLLPRLIGTVVFLSMLFLMLWGFNYGRVPVDEKMGFDRYQPTQDELRERVYEEAVLLSKLRRSITSDTNALSQQLSPMDLESNIRPLVSQALEVHGYPAPGTPRARQLKPKGVLLSWSTAGVYWPWAGEANIDAGLHHLQKPAVMAHEFGHAYGFGDEGTCTFWAYLAGLQATDPYLKYCFKLAYWRQLAGRLRRAEPERYTEWRATELDAGVRNDLQAIYDNQTLYRDIAPVVRDLTYDAYLRTQGVHGGLANYGTVIQLVEGYRARGTRSTSATGASAL